MKSILKRHAPTLFRAMKVGLRGNFELFPPRVKYALPPLHEELLCRFDFRNGVFFEVGANDGLEQSNTAYFERYLGWRGILVEAVPHKFVECVQNRPRAQTFHAALVPQGYAQDYVEIIYSNLMSTSPLSKLNWDEHTSRGGHFLVQDRAILQQRFLAPPRTASSIIEEAGNPQIDLFSIDVEGAEQSVLEGLDFTHHRPKHFLVELRDLKPTEIFLNDHDYELVAKLSKHDYLFRDSQQVSFA